MNTARGFLHMMKLPFPLGPVAVARRTGLHSFTSMRAWFRRSHRGEPVGFFRRSVGWAIPVGAMMAATAVLTAAEQPVVIDKTASHIDIAVKATVDSFVGKLADFTPTVIADVATGKVTTAKITFHFNDVKTGKDKRDNEIHVWQQTDKFPDGEFILSGIESTPDGKFTARGGLSFHGVTKELVFPVTVNRQSGSLTVDGEAVVDTRLFGLPVIRKFALLKVDPLVTVRFHVTGTSATP